MAKKTIKPVDSFWGVLRNGTDDDIRFGLAAIQQHERESNLSAVIRSLIRAGMRDRVSTLPKELQDQIPA